MFSKHLSWCNLWCCLPYTYLVSNNPSHNPYFELAIMELRVSMICEATLLNFESQKLSFQLSCCVGLAWSISEGATESVYQPSAGAFHELSQRLPIAFNEVDLSEFRRRERKPAASIPCCRYFQKQACRKWRPRSRHKWTGPPGFCPEIPDGLSQPRLINTVIIPAHSECEWQVYCAPNPIYKSQQQSPPSNLQQHWWEVIYGECAERVETKLWIKSVRGLWSSVVVTVQCLASADGRTWTCSPRTAESPSSGSAGGVLIVTDFSERLSLLRDLCRSRLRSLKKKVKSKTHDQWAHCMVFAFQYKSAWGGCCCDLML